MLERFKSRRIVGNFKGLLSRRRGLGHISPENRLTNSFIYGIDDKRPDNTSPDNKLENADVFLPDEETDTTAEGKDVLN